jgi:hypothetical protein
LKKFEKTTRNWPLTYTQCLISNVSQLQALFKCLSNEQITDLQYNECIKCIDFIQNLEHKNEQLTNSSLIYPSRSFYKHLKKKDMFKVIWNELETLLKSYQDMSDRHKTLFMSVKKAKAISTRNELVNKKAIDLNSPSQTKQQRSLIERNET